MRGGKGINKVFFVAEVGHGQTKRAVDHDRPIGDADAGPYSQEPIAADFLSNGEICGSAAGIGCRAGKVIVDVQGTEIALEAEDPMTSLKIVASRAAAGETAWAKTNTQLLSMNLFTFILQEKLICNIGFPERCCH